MKFALTEFSEKVLNLPLCFRVHFRSYLSTMEETTSCSKQYEIFKNDIEKRTHDLMDHLESSRGSFWENFQACREYVIGQINLLFTELEKQVLSEQKDIDDKAQEFGMEIMSLFDKIGSCVSAIGSCKKALQTLSTGSHINED
nr:conserved hypothetical protein [Hymenolepis microstoma]